MTGRERLNSILAIVTIASIVLAAAILGYLYIIQPQLAQPVAEDQPAKALAQLEPGYARFYG